MNGIIFMINMVSLVFFGGMTLKILVSFKLSSLALISPSSNIDTFRFIKCWWTTIRKVAGCNFLRWSLACASSEKEPSKLPICGLSKKVWKIHPRVLRIFNNKINPVIGSEKNLRCSLLLRFYVCFVCWMWECFFAARNKDTYTKIGRHGLSPHVGGFIGVAHHLHSVHLNTNTVNTRTGPNQELFPGEHGVVSELCRDRSNVMAGFLALNGPVGNTQLY